MDFLGENKNEFACLITRVSFKRKNIINLAFLVVCSTVTKDITIKTKIPRKT